jgi:ergothioneine biosynthesis protein EgtB
MSSTSGPQPSAADPLANVPDRQTLLALYREIRQQTETLCRPLATEDYCPQTMADVSPPKWHIAHVSWFFETFLLIPFCADYQTFHPQYDYLFNSYYLTHNQPFPRPQRGLLSRPTVAEIYQYRAHVDAAMAQAMASLKDEHWGDFANRLILGLHHEQQHQELLLTDIKHIFAFNPLRPSYDGKAPVSDCSSRRSTSLEWIDYPGGVKRLGYAGTGFCFDNETPHHRVFLNDYTLASRLVTNGEYLEFIEAGGYERPEYWLSDGWNCNRQGDWQAPLYWEKLDGSWWLMTLRGMRPVAEQEPVCHVSFFEADAFARWAGKQLPTEAQWELAAKAQPVAGNLREADCLHPQPAAPRPGISQLFGDVWEWTQSPYLPYPGFRPLAGSLGEYNGKFMCNQMVLRGGSCATPLSHIRPSYRNFFYPGDRWQFSGIRLVAER